MTNHRQRLARLEARQAADNAARSAFAWQVNTPDGVHYVARYVQPNGATVDVASTMPPAHTKLYIGCTPADWP